MTCQVFLLKFCRRTEPDLGRIYSRNDVIAYMISLHQLHGLPAILWEQGKFSVPYFMRPILTPATATDAPSEDVRGTEGLVGKFTNRRSHPNSKITWFNWKGEKNPKPNKLTKKQEETLHKMKQG